MELHQLSLSELQKRMRNGEVTPAEAVQSLENRIASTDAKVRGYLSRDVEKALREAASADVSKPLGGIPIAIKDVINVIGEPIDERGPIKTDKYRPIHRDAPSFI